MALTIHRTTEWTAEQMLPHFDRVIECFEKFVKRFPEDQSVPHMLDCIMSGKNELWVVLDEDGKVILTPITELVTIDATGAKRLRCLDVAGERLMEAMPLLEEIKSYAREQGCKHIELIGRDGWRKLLPEYGFKPFVQVFRCDLSQGVA